MKFNAHEKGLRINTETFNEAAELFLVIASAHTFIGSLTAAAIVAGFYLNCLKRAILFVSAMIAAAGNATADMGVGLFLRHCWSLLMICLRAHLLCDFLIVLCLFSKNSASF